MDIDEIFITQITNEILGESDIIVAKKDTTWWNKEVKKMIKKKKCYLALEKCRNEENLSKLK